MDTVGANQLRALLNAVLLPLAVAAPLPDPEAPWTVYRSPGFELRTNGILGFSSEKELEPYRSSSQSPAYFASGPEGGFIFPGRLAKQK